MKPGSTGASAKSGVSDVRGSRASPRLECERHLVHRRAAEQRHRERNRDRHQEAAPESSHYEVNALCRSGWKVRPDGPSAVQTMM